MAVIRPTVLDRLKARSLPDGDCIVWTGRRDKKGYGKIGVNNKMELAHRASWIATNGPIPEETPCVLHRCDNPPCFNVDHLFLGTIQDNHRDMIEKNRHYQPGKDRNEQCKNGHLYTVETTYRSPKGYRHCRICNKEAQAKRRAKQSKSSMSIPRS